MCCRYLRLTLKCPSLRDSINSPLPSLHLPSYQPLYNSSLFVLLWAYLDIYIGAVQGQKVGYPEARRVTHTLLLSLLLTLVSLTVAIWPIYHAASLVYVCMVSYGVMFQVVILLPASVYNPLFFCAYAAFVYMWTR